MGAGGQTLSGQGRAVNIVTGDGISATVDPATSSILLKSGAPNSPGQKGGTPQGNSTITGTLTVYQSTYLNTASGTTWLGSNGGGNPGILNLYPGSGSYYTGFHASTGMSANVTYTLPASQGASGSMLTDNGSGTLSWTAPPSGWSLTGNAGTTYGTNFIGTTDGQSLQFRVNNQPSGMIEFNGYQNTGLGYEVLSSNTTGYYNAASGYYALYFNTTGGNNTASGYAALVSNTTGSDNTASGTGALDNNTTGINNTANGYRALHNNITGSNNTALGIFADVSMDGLTKATASAHAWPAIGYNAKVGASNSLVLGGTS